MKTIRTGLVILTLVLSLNMNSARAGQPHMQAALDHLRAARTELQVAEHNKGGWRERALNAVNRAIADTEKGISFAR